MCVCRTSARKRACVSEGGGEGNGEKMGERQRQLQNLTPLLQKTEIVGSSLFIRPVLADLHKNEKSTIPERDRQTETDLQRDTEKDRERGREEGLVS